MMDEDRFEEYFRIESAYVPAWRGGATSPLEAEILIKKVTSLLRGACDASIPRRRSSKGRKTVYWWTSEIVELRKESHNMRRRAQRTRDMPETAALS